MNFLSIFQSNLDEFFMVRVGTLYDERKSDVRDNKTRMTSREQLEAVLLTVRRMLKVKDKCYRALTDKLKQNGVEILDYDKLTGKEIYTVALLERKPEGGKKKTPVFGIIPSSGGMLKHLVPITSGSNRFILVEDLMPSIRPTVELKCASLGDDSVIYGALAMIMDSEKNN